MIILRNLLNVAQNNLMKLMNLKAFHITYVLTLIAQSVL